MAKKGAAALQRQVVSLLQERRLEQLAIVRKYIENLERSVQSTGGNIASSVEEPVAAHTDGEELEFDLWED